jgi:hypothetical protein
MRKKTGLLPVFLRPLFINKCLKTNTYKLLLPSGNQDDAVVVDVGAGRPGDDEITGGFEETIGVVMIQQRGCVYVFARCA